MKLKAIYEKQEDIPEAFRELYTESKSGKWELTEVEGIKTTGDVQRVTESLEKERKAHKETKGKLASWAELGETVEEVQGQLDRVGELEVAAEGKIDEGKVNEIVETRLKTKTVPLEREIKKLTEANAELTTANEGLQGEKRLRTLHDRVRADAAAAGIKDEWAINDLLMHSERIFEIAEDGTVTSKDGAQFDGKVLPLGTSPESLLNDPEVASRREAWWPRTSGGGANGSDKPAGNNPWSPSSWNTTAQGAYVQKHGAAKAKAMAESVGSQLGATAPPTAA